jgi:tRNA pseudouridine32 synthase/23S rRNA pseudouridine746 synthase
MRLDPQGQEALTYFRVLERFKGQTLLELSPKTGRTHQLRVHCQAIGHAIIGDKIYGSAPRFTPLPLLLHAQKLTIPHNLKSNSALPRLEIDAPLPAYFAESFAK